MCPDGGLLWKGNFLHIENTAQIISGRNRAKIRKAVESSLVLY